MPSHSDCGSEPVKIYKFRDLMIREDDYKRIEEIVGKNLIPDSIYKKIKTAYERVNLEKAIEDKERDLHNESKRIEELLAEGENLDSIKSELDQLKEKLSRYTK